MRHEGTLKTWNDERGFGFIAPRDGQRDVFVHVSAFARDGTRPRIGEVLTFEIEFSRDGKPRAANIRRPGDVARKAAPHQAAARPPGTPPRQRRGRLGTLITVVLVAAILGVGVGQYQRRSSPVHPAPVDTPRGPAQSAPVDIPRPVPQAASPFRCDGRQHCSQMTSCAEATYFLRNCPGTKMDGDGDGIPCEEQWCTGPSGR